MFLRRAFESGRMQVFHMDMPNDTDSSFDQIQSVGSDERYERACLELIGDFATYEPRGRTVLVEGGSRFDEEILLRLFARELVGVNVASVAGKNEVLAKKKHLLHLQEIQGVHKEIVTIRDGDGIDVSVRTQEENSGDFRWGFYDIESYLIDPSYIAHAIGELTLRSPQDISVRRVEDIIRLSAQSVHQELVNSALVNNLRRSLKKSIDKHVRRPDHSGAICASDLDNLVSGVRAAVDALESQADATTHSALEKELRKLSNVDSSNSIWNSSNWREIVPGKRVLQRVAETLVGTGSYIQIRNVIIASMARDGHKPPGMLATLNHALSFHRNKLID